MKSRRSSTMPPSSSSYSYLFRDPAGISTKTTACLVAHARATAAGTSAFSRSRTRSSPTRSRPRAARGCAGDANGAVAVEACVMRPGCSIRLSTPPRLSASVQIFVRATSATASSSDSSEERDHAAEVAHLARGDLVPGVRRQARGRAPSRRAGAPAGMRRLRARSRSAARMRTASVLSPRSTSQRRTGRGRRRATSAGSAGAPRSSGRSSPAKPPTDVRVAAEVLRRRVDDDVGAELERPLQIRRRERVVDDEDRAGRVRRVGGRADVDDVEQRVRRRLDPDHARALVEVRREVRRTASAGT